MGKIDNESNCFLRILNQMSWCDRIWLFFLIPLIMLFILALGIESANVPPVPPYKNFMAITHWFDPIFFQYNLIMVLLAILILPFLVLSYTTSKIGSKERRLIQELRKSCTDDKEFEEHQENIKRRIGSRASFSAYAFSLSLAMLVVSLGACILLLFKPAYSPNQLGVHFELGANMLMMGPFAELFDKDMEVYFSHLTRGLAAFQYGFLGAYIYFIGSLARAYFTLDLTPHTFVDGSIRMIVASVLALVISFVPVLASASSQEVNAAITAQFASSDAASTAAKSTLAQAQPEKPRATNKESAPRQGLGWIPVISFFFGLYPKQALTYLRGIAAKIANIIYSHRELPLSSLAGISYAHETRLEREGFDNIENLSHADALDLAIRTGFSYKQLSQWIDEAWLAAHLRDDYAEFVKRTGITCRKELQLFFDDCGSIAQATEQLKMVGSSTKSPPGVPWEGKLAALKVLLGSSKPDMQNG